MGVVLTVRTDEALREALRRRAAAQGKSISELVREILESALEERPMGQRVGHLRGCLDLPRPQDDWGRKLREQNWRS
jgi:plasmid stability protein